MKKKRFYILLAIFCLTILVGCGSVQQTDAIPTVEPTVEVLPTNTPTLEPTTTNTPTPSPSPTQVPHIHEWRELEKPATCEVDGKIWDECACGEVQNEVIIPATGHAEYTYQVVVEPSVENDGMYENICNVCGAIVHSGILEKLTPTPTPSPTPSPTPTPTPIPLTNLLYEIQMGDNIWYKFYEDNILVISGTGSTWDFRIRDGGIDCNAVYDYFCEITGHRSPADVCGELTEKVTTIFIEEGVTRIGDSALANGYGFAVDIYLPDTLTEVGRCGFRMVGHFVESVWHNLNLNNLIIVDNSFQWTDALKSYTEEEIEKVIVIPPSPTPTPLPDPNNPQKVGENEVYPGIMLEYWDNGVFVFKGKGIIKYKNSPDYWNPWNYISRYLPDYFEIEGRFHTAIYSEGITNILYDHVKSNSGPYIITTTYLPKSLDISTCAEDSAITIGFYHLKTIHGYFNGKAITITASENEEVCKLAESEGAARLCVGYTLYELAHAIDMMIAEGLTTYTNTEPTYIENMHKYYYKPTITIEWN